MPENNALCCFVFSVAPGGIISVNKHYPTSEGDNFLNYCADEESRERWRAAYAACFALHETQKDIHVRIRLKDSRVVDLISELHWDGGDRVLFYVNREWPYDLLTEREHKVLQLLAGGQDATTISQVIKTSPDNARATISRIRKKLNIVNDDGLTQAALHFRAISKTTN